MTAADVWTVQRVLDLAPDARSAAAARGLARPDPWSQTGSTETLLWGRCQGGGREPYQVTVDLGGPTFECTCPSRKLPCKHGLALLLRWVDGGGRLDDAGAAAATPIRDPKLAAAMGRARDAARAAEARAAPDPDAQARRIEEREALMTAGLDDFERWLFDLVRQGLAAARRQPYRFWDDAAARLVDAQMPALADRVRVTGGEIHERPDWPDFLLAQLGRWYLAVQAWRRRTDLPADVVADLRVMLGWSRRSEEVLAGERVEDHFAVLGIHQDDDDPRLTTRRTWLRGERTGITVVVLDFAAAGMTLQVPQMLGSVLAATVALYPGSPPRRARFTGDEYRAAVAESIAGATTIASALAHHAELVAANPWLARSPMALRAVTPVLDGGRASVVDDDGALIPVVADANLAGLLAQSGGHPVALFGEWSDGHLRPLTFAFGGALHSL
jgi:hypothetical protein